MHHQHKEQFMAVLCAIATVLTFVTLGIFLWLFPCARMFILYNVT